MSGTTTATNNYHSSSNKVVILTEGGSLSSLQDPWVLPARTFRIKRARIPRPLWKLSRLTQHWQILSVRMRAWMHGCTNYRTECLVFFSVYPVYLIDSYIFLHPSIHPFINLSYELLFPEKSIFQKIRKFPPSLPPLPPFS